jgi:4-amino-4-deoxy-L-arabinose transferase-like glycosyltransferase
VFVVGGVVFAVLMALSSRYGFDRDELYFFDAARHLQGGYVDQPIVAPLFARLTLALFGVSQPGLRLWPALAAFATVVMGGLIARELGGGGRAQVLAAVAVATSPAVVAADHLEGPTAYDVLAWAALALFLIRIGRTREPKWWLAAGAVLGAGLANKHSVGIFAAAILMGAVLSRCGRVFFNWWALAGLAIAAIFAIPDVVWQAGHGWPTIAMTRQLNQENGGIGNIGNWIAGQFIMTALVFVPLWIAGLRWLWRSGVPMWKALVWAYGILFIAFGISTGGKIYYLLGAYVYLSAAGAVFLDQRLAGRPIWSGRLVAALAISTAVALPIVLPVLPANAIGWTYKINQVPGESLGWPQMTATVRARWFALPASQRADAVIYTGDYGEAGAINELGRGTGLPRAVSAHNNEWFWGAGNPDATTVLAVAPGPRDVTGYQQYLERYFRSVVAVATFTNPAGIHNQEWGGHVYLCSQPLRPWGQIWLQLRHYD